MPLGDKPECVKCGTRETPLWHSTETGNLCNTCLEDERISETNPTARNEEEDKGGLLKPTRRSTRITRYCNSKTGISHKILPKGKGRRNLFKKTVRVLVLLLINFTRSTLFPVPCSQLKHQRPQQLQSPVALCSTRALISKWAI